jgi:UDP-3-O-[3-hydroxymyristoyl] N-acetylglucosamine deacetylase / 3-hydroxyacyl-[acyl-carrier-protein] dehydratase
MSDKQKTIKTPFSYSGKGLHTGIEITVTVKPAEVDFGYKFKRIDLSPTVTIAAVAENVTETARGTVIGSSNASISTIEHLLASLYASGIDNAEIELNGPEVPILDGSSKPWMDAITTSGIEEQSEDKRYFIIKKKTVYTDEESGVQIIAYPDETLNFDVKIGYDSPYLKNQYACLEDIADFGKEIAECRTFVFFREIEKLAKMNLIKGGDLSNAIVIVDHNVTQDEVDTIANLFGKEKIEIKSQGVLNNIELKYDNEPARHKLLDLIGDLSLCGVPIKGRIIATHPGHKANTEFAKILRVAIKKEKGKPVAPQIDIYAEPVIDIEGIKNLLPHRYPFLLVDKIMKLTPTSIIGMKNVTFNENFFMGHFPKESVFPGVLQVEALAQCGGVLVLSQVPDPENYLTYFVSVKEVKWRRKVVPGDVLIFVLDFLSPFRRGIAHMKATAFVGDQIACEGEMMAQIVKKQAE